MLLKDMGTTKDPIFDLAYQINKAVFESWRIGAIGHHEWADWLGDLANRLDQLVASQGAWGINEQSLLSKIAEAFGFSDNPDIELLLKRMRETVIQIGAIIAFTKDGKTKSCTRTILPGVSLFVEALGRNSQFANLKIPES